MRRCSSCSRLIRDDVVSSRWVCLTSKSSSTAVDVLLEGTNNCNVHARRVLFFSVGNFKLCGKKSCFFVLNTTLYIPSYRLNKISSRWWCQVRFALTLKMISCLILTKIGQSSWNHHYYCRILQPPHLSDQLVFSLFHVGWMMVSSLWFLPYTR